MNIKSFINLLSIFAFFLWWGGFTFYAAFVIPTGQKILGSHVQMGFISQQVTTQINFAALIACVLLFLNEFIRNEWKFNQIKLLDKICLILMLAIVIFLFFFHPYLVALLDFQNIKVIDEPHFYFLHRIYLILSSILWLLGIIYMYRFFRKLN
jgi:hypothetical protein